MPDTQTPKRGRPATGITRTVNMPRISAESHEKLKALAERRACSLADALEFAIDRAAKAKPRK